MKMINFAIKSIIDLSHTISANTKTYPGDIPPKLKNINTIANNGFQDTLIQFTSHIGTHIDGAAHFYKSSNTIDNYSIYNFFGKGIILNYKNGVNSEKILLQILKDDSVDFVLFYSGWDSKWNTKEYYINPPYLKEPLLDILISKNLKGIGMDFPSPDPIDTKNYVAHKKLLINNILIVENLTNLSALINEDFYFCCFPLKLKECDASPIRAVAFIKS